MSEGVVDKVRAAGGEVYAITSEPQRLADMAKEQWDLPFESIGDPHHEISGACKQQNWLDLIVNEETDLFVSTEEVTYSHPNGYFQPGVLALDKASRVLYRWRGIPTRANIGGAIGRPTAGYVFENISQALKPQAIATGDVTLDSNPELDSRGIPWPLFLSLLVANGWFIKPRVFRWNKRGLSVRARLGLAMLKLPLFIGLWIVAFMQLPVVLVSLALLGWAAWLTPHIRHFNRQFQNVKMP